MRKGMYWLLPIAWMGVIYYASSQPYEKQDMKPILANTIDLSFLEPVFNWISFTYHRSEVSIHALGIEGFIEFFIRKGAHFSVFFLLLCFIYLAFVKSTQFRKHTILVVSLLLSIVYACFDEIHQGFTVNRTPYVGDVIIDGIGALFAVCVIMIFGRRKKMRHKTMIQN